MIAIYWIFRRTPPRRSITGSAACSSLSAAAFSLSHGANDAQKTMGIIAGRCCSRPGYITDRSTSPSGWMLAAHAAIGLGTPRRRVADHPHDGLARSPSSSRWDGFAAETGAAIAVFTATSFGVPVSTTHAITGAIVGVGSHPATLGGPLGRGRADRLGVGADHSRRGADRRDHLLADLSLRHSLSDPAVESIAGVSRFGGRHFLIDPSPELHSSFVRTVQSVP